MVFPSLNKQVVLVIGTKQGIGAAVVETFLKEEAIVIAADIGYVAQKLTQLSPNHYQIHLNIAKESQLIGLVNQLEEQQLIPDVFVAVAGISTMAFLTESATQDYDKVQEVNARGVYLSCKYIVRLMQKHQKAGRVILIASQAGKKWLSWHVGLCGFQACSLRTDENVSN